MSDMVWIVFVVVMFLVAGSYDDERTKRVACEQQLNVQSDHPQQDTQQPDSGTEPNRSKR